jgi:hypothetical protein
VGVAAEEMVQPEDLGEGLRFLLRTSPSCLVREVEFVPRAQNEIIRRLAAAREGAAMSISEGAQQPLQVALVVPRAD